MPLKKDQWPHFYFYDVSHPGGKKLKVHKDDCKLKTGSTKGHGCGSYYAIIAKGMNSNNNDIWKYK